ncbi:hypothetical protein GCM10010145_43170 [Streptomyces ruber]|uniref:SnoaL-like domain-containing protein n=2 Tax=Streptomyces TaxID=1883 RepID=A0A918BJR9_9ACTN|nr:hypothetical protein GCM10010145_43170 [Streptomyces ruber]
MVSASRARAAVDAFRRTLETRDPQGLLDVLAPEVVLVNDGGGVGRAALRPIVGTDKVVRYIIGGTGRTRATLALPPPWPTAARRSSYGWTAGRLDGWTAGRLDGEIDAS